MNIVFIGASQFGVRCLDVLFNIPNISITGVVTAPKYFKISYAPERIVKNVLYADIGQFALQKEVPVKQLRHGMQDPHLFDTIASWNPDIFLVAGWYHMIPKNWRDLAPAYGLHASLLPDYSGGAPLVWAMINGETKTGITLFQMDDGVDSGPIVGQAEEPIYPTDTIAKLYARIEERGLELLRRELPNIVAGTFTLRSQDESKRRIMPQRSPEDGRIDWRVDATTIDRFVRAQTRPYPGAFSTLEGEKLIIWKAQKEIESTSAPPGMIQKDGNDYSVSCNYRKIKLKEVTFDGRDYSQANLCDLFACGGQTLGR